MGNLCACLSPRPPKKRTRPVKRLSNTPAAAPSNRWSRVRSSSNNKLDDSALIREQALAAAILFRQHQQQHNGSLPPFDRSASLRYPNSSSSSSKRQSLPRSSSSRARSLTDPLLQPHQLVNQDVKITDLETNHFVLVHGGGFGAWCWYKTIALLEEGGFEVTAIDLSGSGIDSFDTNGITTLSQYIKPLTNFLKKLDDGQKVILVGHDLGGACISHAMELFSHKITKAVFIAAVMLMSGQSTLDLLKQAAASNDLMQQAQIFLYGHGNDRPATAIELDKSLLRDLLFNKSPAKDVALASVSMRPIPFSPLLEKLSLSDTKHGLVRRFYIETPEDHAMPISVQEAMVSSAPPERVFRLKGADHSPFFSKPQALHKLLVEISKIPAASSDFSLPSPPSVLGCNAKTTERPNRISEIAESRIISKWRPIIQTSEEDPQLSVVRFTSDLAWADAGPEAANPQVGRLSIEAQECMVAGRWLDLVSMMLTSADLIFSKLSEKDLECIFTVICNVVTKSENPDEILEMAKLISSKLAQQPNDKPALRLKILFNLYNLLSIPYSRFCVYMQALNLAVNGKVVDHIVPSFKKIDAFLKEWNLDVKDRRELFLAMSIVAKENKISPKDSFKFLTKYLATFSGEDAVAMSEAKEEAVRAVIEFLKCDLLDMPAVGQLENDSRNSAVYQLLKIFLTKSLDSYLEYQAANSSLLKNYGLVHEDCVTKMRLMSLVDLGSNESGQIPYAVIRDTLQINDDEVEYWVVKAISAKLLDCKMDQMNELVIVSCCSEQVFGERQWELLQAKLATWRENVASVVTAIQA